MFGSLAGSIALYRSGFLGAVRGCRSECVGSCEGHARCYVTGAWGAFRFLRIGASSLGCAEFRDPFVCVGAHAGDLGSCFGYHVEVVGWQLRSASAFRSTAGPPRGGNVSPRDPFLLVEFRPSKVNAEPGDRGRRPPSPSCGQTCWEVSAARANTAGVWRPRAAELKNFCVRFGSGPAASGQAPGSLWIVLGQLLGSRRAVPGQFPGSPLTASWQPGGSSLAAPGRLPGCSPAVWAVRGQLFGSSWDGLWASF